MYGAKCRSELCRNCVRSPRKHPQIPTFTGSHREAFWGGKSLNRLREEVIQHHSVSIAGFVFQACLIDRSSISPFRINQLQRRRPEANLNCDTSPNLLQSLTAIPTNHP